MKPETPGGDARRELTARLRDELRGTAQRARALAAELRAVAGLAAPEPQAEPPRRGGEDLWELHGGASRGDAEADAEAPTLIDEEGEESALPLEFATTTMGLLLLGQGRHREAARVFRAVLQRTPEDAEARRGLLVARRALPAEASPKESAPMEPLGLLDRLPPPWAYNVAEAVALPVDPRSIVVFWELTESTLTRAGEQTGWGARRALRVQSVLHTPDGVHRTERLIEEVPGIGDWFVTDLPPGATHLATVGLLHGDRFVPIAHAAPVTTPRGKPSEAPTRVRATVSIPPPGDDPPVPSSGQWIVALHGPVDAMEALALTMPSPPTARLPEESRPGLDLVGEGASGAGADPVQAPSSRY
ncbi:MAG: DUF4912 domain-containing protein [Deltaproteobacteria bacterium]|nr:DUF4912 domain-containing protein [Deltaproteobacteria bacterium]